MNRERLTSLLEVILNEAELPDLEVLDEAIARRRGDLNAVGSLKMSPRSMAERISSGLHEQMSATRTQIQGMVREHVIQLIREKAPDIPDEHLQALLAEWVPNEADKARRGPPRPPAIPVDAHLAMVRDFVNFALGRMAMDKQAQLRAEVPDWQAQYWDTFPERVRKLILVFLENKLDGPVFWDEVKETLAGNRRDSPGG